AESRRQRLPANIPIPRFGSGSDSRYYRRFWVITIRWLAAGRRNRTNSPVTLELAKTSCQPDEAVAATVQLRGAESKRIEGAQVVLTLSDQSGDARTLKTEYDPASHAYVASLNPGAPGSFIVNALATLNGQPLGEDKQVLVSEATD